MGKPVTKWLTLAAGFFIPPACREEVFGDLCERSSTALEFCIEAAGTIPCLILAACAAAPTCNNSCSMPALSSALRLLFAPQSASPRGPQAL